MRKIRNHFVAASLFIVTAMGASCDKTVVAPTSQPAVILDVFTSTYLLADIVRSIGGDAVRVDWVLDLGDSINDFSPTDEQRQRMLTADMIVLDGVRRYEHWAAPRVGQPGVDRLAVSIENLPFARTAPPNGLLQLDPVAVIELSNKIAERLSDTVRDTDTRQAELFRTNGQAFAQRVKQVLTDNPNNLFGRGVVVVLDDTYAPLFDRFGVRSVRVDADPLRLSNDDIRKIMRTAKDNAAKVLVVGFDTPPGTLVSIAQRTQLRVETLDPLGFANYAGHDTYIDVLKYNLDQLRRATNAAQ